MPLEDCDPSQRSSSSRAFSLFRASVRAVPTEALAVRPWFKHCHLDCRQCDMDSMEAAKKVFIILAMRPSLLT